MRPGEQCVMMLGTIQMLMQFAQVLATPDSVRQHQCNNFILVWVESLIYTSVSISMQFSKCIVIIRAGRAIAPPIKVSDEMPNCSLIIASFPGFPVWKQGQLQPATPSPLCSDCTPDIINHYIVGCSQMYIYIRNFYLFSFIPRLRHFCPSVCLYNSLWKQKSSSSDLSVFVVKTH